MAKKKRTTTRAPGMTQISISLPEKLVARIDELAESENRNRSNYIGTYLERLSQQHELAEKKGTEFKI